LQRVPADPVMDPRSTGPQTHTVSDGQPRAFRQPGPAETPYANAFLGTLLPPASVPTPQGQW